MVQISLGLGFCNTARKTNKVKGLYLLEQETLLRTDNKHLVIRQ